MCADRRRNVCAQRIGSEQGKAMENRMIIELQRDDHCDHGWPSLLLFIWGVNELEGFMRILVSFRGR